MAGGGSGEEENYWPGYVDALTTMTMVLTFIMMILGVVIFSMSQNVSKILIQQIAEAAKIEIKGGGSAEQVRDQVIAALKTKKSEEVKDGEDTTQYALKGESIAMPAPAQRNSGPTKLPSPPQNQVQEPGNLAGNTASDQPMTDPHEQKKVSPPPSPLNEDPGKLEKDKRVDSTTVNEIAQKSSGVAVSGDGAIITVAFQKRVIQLDEAATTDFRKITMESAPIKAASRIEIKGFADVSVMGVTEARRIAYYRAMLIRKQLMSTGVDPEKIAVRIEDSASSDGDIVRVIAR